MVDKALDLGITLIDTADTYGNKGGSEEILGKILGPRRKDIVLATKFGLPMDDAGKLSGASRRYIMQAVEASLRRLQDRLDRSLSVASARSADADRGNAARARRSGEGRKGPLHRLLNLSAAQLEEAQAVARQHGLASFVSCQDEYSLLERDLEKDRVPSCASTALACCRTFRSPADC